MSAPVKITYSVVVLAGIAVASLWWLGRRSLMQKRHLQIEAAMSQANDQPPPSLEPQAVPAALPPA
jgi:hypothetical protein